jgi:hypothetical protein
VRAFEPRNRSGQGEHTRSYPPPKAGAQVGMAEPRWWWAFEGSRYQSPASIAATVPSIADRVELGHGGLGEVAAVKRLPTRRGCRRGRLRRDGSRRARWEDADDAGAAFDLIVDPLEVASSISGPILGKLAASAAIVPTESFHRACVEPGRPLLCPYAGGGPDQVRPPGRGSDR